jgi:hypothetical protein
MLGWLSSGFWFLPLTVNIFISTSTQIESAELNSSSIHLAIARHTDSFLLVKDPTLVTSGSS